MTKRPALGDDVLGDIPSPEAIMRKHFYRKSEEEAAEPEVQPSPTEEDEEDTGFRRVNISLFPEDIELLDTMVRTLRKRGYRRVSKSQIIRYALQTVDLEKMPQSY